MTFNIKGMLSKFNKMFTTSGTLKDEQIQVQMRLAQYKAGLKLKD